MEDHEFEQQIEAAQARLRELLRRIAQPDTDEPVLVKAAVEDLSASLEELHVAQEELRQQNEELVAVREQLAAERQRYQDLFAFAPDGYLVTDAEGLIQEANRAASELLAVRQAFLVGKPLAVFVAEETRAAFYAQLSRFQAGETPSREPWEAHMYPRYGDPFPAAVTTAPVWDADGGLVGLRWLIRDITLRKQAEEALEESLAKYRVLFESFPLGITIADSSRGVIEANVESERLLGISQEEHKRRYIDGENWQIIRPDGSPMPAEEYASVRALEEGRLIENVEMGIVKSEGEITWINVTAAPLEDDRVVVTYHDITGRRRAEEALWNSEQRYRRLFETMAEGVALHKIIYDEMGVPVDYVIIAVNPAYQEQSGIAHETALGQRASELYGTDAPPYLDKYAHVAMTGEPTTFEVYFPPLRRHFRISVFSPIEGQFATVFADITARKRAEQDLAHYAEELQRSNEDLQQFAYIVSHDLKAPLRMVKSFLDLLEKNIQDHLDTETEEYIHFAVDGAVQMEALIDALLAYARVGTRGQEPVPTDAEEVLGEVLHTLRFEIASCEAQVTHDPLPIVLVDSTQLAQVFQNLIGNALKFSRDAPPCVHITAERHPSPMGESWDAGKSISDAWRFAVRDNGIGIAPEDQTRIFGVFQRLHTRKAYEGTGIGLAVCKRIVERHGGCIWVESEVGQGATFYFTLPGNG